MGDVFQIESIDGIMEAEVNGHDGFRVFATLNEPVSSLGEGRGIHVFAKKEGRWKAGDEVEVESVNENFNLNGPGEEDLPEGEGTYVYARLNKPQNRQRGGRFTRQSKGFNKPKSQGFKKPVSNGTNASDATVTRQAQTPAAAYAKEVVKKVSLEEADVVYDRLLGESLRACEHTLRDYLGSDTGVSPDQAASLITTMANVRAQAFFTAYVHGKVDITPKTNPIRELIKGTDRDVSSTEYEDDEYGQAD